MNKRLNVKGEQGGALANLIVLLCLAALCALVYFARHPLMRLAAEFWVVDEPAAHADALVVLGDDNFYADRATHAVELFRQGVAPLVVASGRRLRPNAGISELIEHDLVERGVPKEKVLRFAHDGGSTVEEAIAVAKLAEDHRWKSVVIVTSNYHARRVRYIYGKIMPRQTSVSVASAHDGEFDPERWWEKRESTKLFAHEILGMVEAIWELHGENKGTTGMAQLWMEVVRTRGEA
jgi:uncharacterized SAM-binding protein YcdF (DUF218 family)